MTGLWAASEAEFERFGAGCGALLRAPAAVAVLLARYARASRGSAAADRVGDCLVFLIVAAFVADPFVDLAAEGLSLKTSLPLELCDAAGFAAIVALQTRRQTAFELAYYWGLTATVQALLTPAPETHFWHPNTVRYFALHSGIVVAAVYLAAGLGMRPRRDGPWRALLWTAVYTAFVGLIDWATGANYMWLREKPPGSILGFFGPWPFYIAGGGAVGLALFWLVHLPYLRRAP